MIRNPFVKLKHLYELLGNVKESKRYYDLAAQLGVIYQVD